MSRSVFVGASLIMSLVLAPNASAEPVGRGELAVRVRNFAAVSPATLAGAGRLARAILERAGVETSWRDDTGGDGQSEFLLEILGRRQCTALARSSDTLGLALLSRNEAEPHYAAVFLEKAEALARLGVASTEQVLGHAMAHEIGHLLLGTSEHASTGIMQARWSGPELQRAAWGQLLFTSEQSARLRAAVARREPPTPLLALPPEAASWLGP